MKRLILQPAFVLHRRAYRESSFLVDLFTLDYGKVTAVAKGVRKIHSSSQGLLQPFIPLLVSLSGRGELMSLNQVELNGQVARLQGECLFAGFYLNELLTCLLEKWDAHPKLFHAYAEAVNALKMTYLEQKTLRIFEKRLLDELGYGPLPKPSNLLHNMFSSDKHYRFVPEQGFYLDEGIEPRLTTANLFSGKSLLAIAEDDWEQEITIRDAKRLTRLILTPLLGKRPIYSRQLFIQEQEEKH